MSADADALEWFKRQRAQQPQYACTRPGCSWSGPIDSKLCRSCKVCGGRVRAIHLAKTGESKT